MFDEAAQRYVPRQTPDAKFYWEGIAAHRLLYQVCNGCSEVVFHPRAVCPYCLSSDLRVEESAGRGAIYSLSVIHHATVPWFQARVPYAVGIVEVDEGFHMFTALLADDPEELHIGQRVAVTFTAMTESVTIPEFRIDDAGSGRGGDE